MARDQSIAPKERVNITYRSESGIGQEVELPLKLLVMGDFIQKVDPRPLEQRTPIRIDKENFDQVLAAHDLRLDIQVPHVLRRTDVEEDLTCSLTFQSIRDFEPDRLAQQIPVLRQLIEIREALVALKDPLGNMPGFRKKLQSILMQAEQRQQLVSELKQVTAVPHSTDIPSTEQRGMVS